MKTTKINMYNQYVTCPDCNNWIIHSENIYISSSESEIYKPKKIFQKRYEQSQLPYLHKSCLCILFRNSSICCVEGYKNLLKLFPQFVVYGPVPISANNMSESISEDINHCHILRQEIYLNAIQQICHNLKL